MLKEFKEFINRGNVIDLAVAVVMGGAFGKIVSALVDNVIMPLIGVVLGGIDFSSASVTLSGGAELQYGLFIQAVIDFLIVSFVIFMIVKQINRFKKPVEEEVTTKECPHCLTEIPLGATRCPNCTSELAK